MDQDIENEPVILHCHICDFERKSNAIVQDIEEWHMHSLNFPELTINILTCPRCTYLNIEDIFAVYKLKIRTGKNLSYH